MCKIWVQLIPSEYGYGRFTFLILAGLQFACNCRNFTLWRILSINLPFGRKANTSREIVPWPTPVTPFPSVIAPVPVGKSIFYAMSYKHKSGLKSRLWGPKNLQISPESHNPIVGSRNPLNWNITSSLKSCSSGIQMFSYWDGLNSFGCFVKFEYSYSFSFAMWVVHLMLVMWSKLSDWDNGDGPPSLNRLNWRSTLNQVKSWLFLKLSFDDGMYSDRLSNHTLIDSIELFTPQNLLLFCTEASDKTEMGD